MVLSSMQSMGPFLVFVSMLLISGSLYVVGDYYASPISSHLSPELARPFDMYAGQCGPYLCSFVCRIQNYSYFSVFSDLSCYCSSSLRSGCVPWQDCAKVQAIFYYPLSLISFPRGPFSTYSPILFRNYSLEMYNQLVLVVNDRTPYVLMDNSTTFVSRGPGRYKVYATIVGLLQNTTPSTEFDVLDAPPSVTSWCDNTYADSNISCHVNILPWLHPTAIEFYINNQLVENRTNSPGSCYSYIGQEFSDDAINQPCTSSEAGKLYVSPNHKFSTDSFLLAFEFYVKKPGLINFYILERVCRSRGHLYDITGAICPPYVSDIDDIYFYPFLDLGATRSGVEPDDTWSIPESGSYSEFMIVYKFPEFTTVAGLNSFKLTDGYKFRMQSGYQLGWVSTSCLSYHPSSQRLVDPLPELVFSFKLLSSLQYFTNSNSSVFYGQHLVLAHVVTPAVQHFFHAYPASTDLLTFKAVLNLHAGSSNTTILTNSFWHVPPLVGEATLESSSVLSIGDVVQIDFNVVSGYSVSCSVHWGESVYTGNYNITQDCSSNFFYRYTAAGQYTIHTSISDIMGRLNRVFNVSVYGQVMGLFRYVDPVLNTVGGTTCFHLFLHSQAAFLIDIDFGTGMIPSFQDTVYPNSSFCTVCATYITNGSFMVMMKLSNPLYTSTMETNIQIQQPIKQLTIDAPQFVVVNQRVIFRAVVNSGSDLVYVWMLNGSNTDQSSSNGPLASAVYSAPGQRMVVVKASNLVSNSSAYVFINIYKIVQNLDRLYLNSVDVAVSGETYQYMLLVHDGTEVTITCFTSFGVNRSISVPEIVGSLVVQMKFVPQAPGWMRINCTAYNRVSALWYNDSINTQERVSELCVSVISNSPLGSMEVNETFNLSIQARGSDPMVLVDWGDGSITKTSSFLISKQYSSWASPFRAVILVSNSVSSATVPLDIFVLKPVVPILMGDLMLVQTTTGQTQVVPSLLEGNEFTCNFTWEDRIVSQLTYTDYLARSYPSRVFPKLTTHTVNWTCMNRLYHVSTLWTGTPIIPVQNFDISFAEYSGSSIDLKSVPYPKCCYSCLSSLFIIFARQATNLVNYNVSLSTGVTFNLLGVTVPTTSALINFTDCSNATINYTVIGWNKVNRLVKSGMVLVFSPMGKLTLVVEKTAQKNTIIKIRMGFEHIGDTPCFQIDFGDLTFVSFGDAHCRSDPKNLGFSFNSGIFSGQSVFTLEHVYMVSGSYVVKGVGWNRFSMESASSVVTVLDIECNVPTIHLSGVSLSPANVLAYPRSASVQIESQISIDCRSSKTVLQSWSLFSMGQSTRSRENLILSEFSSDSVVVFQPRSLSYGMYKFLLNASMLNVVAAASLVAGYFEVKPSQVQAVFVGDSGAAVGWGSMVVINASLSFDPDAASNSLSNLDFRWFCKQEQEGFDDPITMVTQGSSTVTRLNVFDNYTYPGCFNASNSSVELGFARGLPVLFFNSSIMKPRGVYNIRVVVSSKEDDTRPAGENTYTLSVLNTSAPLLHLRCLMNCGRRSNPTERVVISGSCSDCNFSLGMGWRWTMQYRLASSISDVYQEFPDLASIVNTGITTPNLVIRENQLSPSYHYNLVLSVLMFQTVLTFSSYFIQLNSPPSGGSCEVQPMKGFAVSTSFSINCKQWKVDHNPLQYNYYYFQYQHGSYLLLRSTLSSSSTNFYLSTGDPARNYTVSIRVQIEDAYGSHAFSDLVVQVFPTKLLTASQIKLKLIAMKETRDTMSAVQLVNAWVGSISSISSIGQVEVLNQLMTMICSYPVGNKRVVESMVDAISSLVKISPRISPSTQDVVVKTLMSLSNIILSVDYTHFTFLLSLSTKILFGADKATQGLIQTGTANMVHTINVQLGGALSRNLIPGEPSVVIDLPSRRVSVSSVDPSQTAITIIGNASFTTLPLTGIVNDSSVGVVAMTGKNTFAGVGYDNIKSNVFSLDLVTSQNHEIILRNLLNPVVLSISTPELAANTVTSMFTTGCRPVMIHRLNLLTNESAMVIHVEPVNASSDSIVLSVNIARGKNCYNYSDFVVYLPRRVQTPLKSSTASSHPQPSLSWTFVVDHTFWGDSSIGQYFICVSLDRNLNTSNSSQPYSACSPSSSSSYSVVNNITKEMTISYKIAMYTTSCVFWNKDLSKWGGHGCKVGHETTFAATQCLCNHLTSFALSSLFQPVNPINLRDLLRNAADPSKNKTIALTLGLAYLIYFVMLAFCWWKDKVARKMAMKILMEDNDPNDKYMYEIGLQTGHMMGSGTTADVFITLHGDFDETPLRRLTQSGHSCFQRGQLDVFIMAVPCQLGDIKKATVCHNNKGQDPSWFLSQFQIRDVQTGQTWWFICNRWLAVDRQDGQIRVEVALANRKDLRQFQLVFPQTVHRKLFNDHIWFSVFLRPPRSTFTHCQRLHCCMSIFFTLMLANAMFYKDAGGLESTSGAELRLGPLVIKLREFITSIISAVIAVPVNMIIILIFRRAAPPKSEHSSYAILDDEQEELEGDYTMTKEEVVEQRRAQMLEMMFGNVATNQYDGNKRAKKWPHWLIYVAYALLFLAIGSSTVVVAMYGITWGNAKTTSWIRSVVLGFIQDSFIKEPIKVLILSVMIALVARNPTKEVEEQMEEGDIVTPSPANAAVNSSQRFSEVQFPDEKLLEECRQIGLKRQKMWAVVREISLQLSVSLLFFYVAFSNVNPNMPLLLSTIQNQLVTSKNPGVTTTITKITGTEDYWRFLKERLVPFLYPGHWYNGQNYPKKFVADSASSIPLAQARIRQLRLKKNSCQVLPGMKSIISECNDQFGLISEDVNSYSLGWGPVLNDTQKNQIKLGRKKSYWQGYILPWEYQSSLQLRALPLLAGFATYSGGGYAVNLGFDGNMSLITLSRLQSHNWVDQYTRALFHEFNLYNPNTGVLLSLQLILEVLPTGSWVYFHSNSAVITDRYIDTHGLINAIMDLVFFVITLVYIYCQVKMVWTSGLKSFFTSFWTFADMVLTLLCVTSIGMYLAKLTALSSTMMQYKDNQDLYVSFVFIVVLDSCINFFMGIIVFLSTVRFIRILRFNNSIKAMLETLRVSVDKIFGFGLIFFIILIAYTSCQYLVIGAFIKDSSTFSETFCTIFGFILGKIDNARAYIDVQPVVGSFLFISFMLMVQTCLVNVFIGIINASFKDARINLQRHEEFELLGFVMNRVKNIIGMKVAPPIKPLYRKLPTTLDKVTTDISERTNRLIYKINHEESDDMRCTLWMRRKLDVKKRNVILAVIGVANIETEEDFSIVLPVINNYLKRMSVQDSWSLLKAVCLWRRQTIASQRGSNQTVLTTVTGINPPN